MAKKIGILNGGGDCAGLNAVISSIVKAGSRNGYEFVGIMRGFEGLLGNCECMDLPLDYVKDIAATGGTILKTTNKGKFAAKSGSGDTNKIPDEILQEVKDNMGRLQLDSLVVIGGDGTLSGALQLQKIGVKIVAVPKTIDNDLQMTDRTFGFSTAVDVVADALDRIQTTAESHSRVIIVETMGRNAGWLALYGGIAGNADTVLIPEIDFTYSNVVRALRAQRKQGENSSIIVVAEGATPVGESPTLASKEQNKENLLGGIANKLMHEIRDRSEPDEFEIRIVVLGHVQRGGAPNADDRILAQRYGVAAMELIVQEKFGRMVSLEGTHITSVNIADAVKSICNIEPDSEVLRAARDLGIYFGD